MSRKHRIEELLKQELTPSYLNIEDESGGHNVPENAQTHFKVTAVSTCFKGLSPLARHRIVNHLLHKEFELGLHALSMHLFTADEWEKRNKSVLNSPACKGGLRKKSSGDLGAKIFSAK